MAKRKSAALMKKFEQLKKKVGFMAAVAALQDLLPTEFFIVGRSLDELIDMLGAKGFGPARRLDIYTAAMDHHEMTIEHYERLTEVASELIDDNDLKKICAIVSRPNYLIVLESDYPRTNFPGVNTIAKAIERRIGATYWPFEEVSLCLSGQGKPKGLFGCLFKAGVGACETLEQARKLGGHIYDHLNRPGANAKDQIPLTGLLKVFAKRIDRMKAPFSEWKSAHETFRSPKGPHRQAIWRGMMRSAKTTENWLEVYKLADDQTDIDLALQAIRKLAG